MNRLALTGLVVALLPGPSLVLAQAPADEHAGHHPPGISEPSTSPAAKPPTQAASPTAMPRMQDNMKNMQVLMARIHASKDSPARLKLMKQHSKAMQDQMGMMRGMVGSEGGMMGGGMKMEGATPPPGAQEASPKGEGMMSHDMMDHQAMQSRMNMMQMMMDQMLQHLDAMQEPQSGK